MARTLTLKRATPPPITGRDRRELVVDGERAEQRVKDIVYLDLEDLTGGIEQYVVSPGLGALAGPLGALALAADAHATAAEADPPGG